MSYPAKVYVVDDNKEIRKSIQWLVESVGYEINTFEDPEYFLEAFDESRPSCLVLDIRMPNMSGLELQEILLSKKIHVPIIFITGHGDIPMAVHAMKSGAVDFLTKPINNQALLDSINKSIKKDTARRLKQEKYEKVLSLSKTLTKREFEVLALIVKGLVTKTIATELGISPHTVELHRAKIMKKMQAGSIAELVSTVVHCGVVDL